MLRRISSVSSSEVVNPCVPEDPVADTNDPTRTTKPAVRAGFMRYRYGDSNPGFRRERAAS